MCSNKSTKAIALLMSMTMITSVFVGNTLSRYVTSVSSTDNARVAVWGINGDEVTMELFNTEYDIDGKLIAKSNVDGEKIIAPGTGGQSAFSIINFDQNIPPETMYQVKIELDETEADEDIINNPSIQWKLDNGSWGTWYELKQSILKLSGNNTVSDEDVNEIEEYYGRVNLTSNGYYNLNTRLIIEYDVVDGNGNGNKKEIEVKIGDVLNRDEINFEKSHLEGEKYTFKIRKDTNSNLSYIYNPGEFATAFKDDVEHTISWQWALDGNNEADTKMGNGKIVKTYVDTGVKDDDGYPVYDIVEKKIQGSVKLKVKITAEQIVGNLTNSTWKFNNTINDLSMFDYFNYQEQTGWENLPSDTVIKGDNLEFKIVGLSKQSVLGLDVLTTIAHSGYTIAYIPENDLGLPSGWYEVPEEVTGLIVSGSIGPDNMMTVLSQLVPTSSPTITFAGKSTNFSTSSDFINWMVENAVKQ